MIVLPDADIDMAADAAVSAGYGSAGERCMAIATVVAVGDVADPLVEAIKERLPKIKVGPGSDPASEMGPLVTQRAPRQGRVVPRQRRRPRARRSSTDGREHPLYDESDGFFLGVSLIDHVTPAMDAYRDEIFGPVLDGHARRRPTTRRSSSSTTTRTATARRSSPATAARPASSSSRSNAGMVGINVPIPVPVAYYSFGGWKDSLFGDLHMYGPEGIQFYTRAKVVTSRWPDPGTSQGRPRASRARAEGTAGHRDGR